MNEENQSLEQNIQDLLGAGGFSDDDLLKTVDKHTLQLTGHQIKCLMYLYSFKNALVDEWVAEYLEIKHHNRSGELIIGALNAIALRRFINQFRFNVNTTK